MEPYVICHMMGTLDGRIISKKWPLENPSQYFEGPASKIKVDAWIVGRVTMQEFSSRKKPRLGKANTRIPKTDFVGKHSAKTYAVAIDPSGKCTWDTNMVSTEHVIEVLTEKVPNDYLAHLRSKEVSYIFAGKTALDLKLALEKLNQHFGIKRVRIDGGGHVNGSFLKAGLINEFSLVLAPIADGTSGSPTVFEVSDDSPQRKATRFYIKSVKRIDRDFLWIRYLAEKENRS